MASEKGQNGFYRASTVTHKFKLSKPLNLLSDARICYSQDDEVILIKTLSDCQIDSDNNTLILELTQEDTKKFARKNVNIQFRVKTLDNKVIPSKVYITKCHDVLDDEVM